MESEGGHRAVRLLRWVDGELSGTEEGPDWLCAITLWVRLGVCGAVMQRNKFYPRLIHDSSKCDVD